MLQTSEAGYLQRPLLEGVEYKIKEDYLEISSPHTIFAQGHRLSVLRQDSLLSLYQDVMRTAKSRKIKISYTRHFKKAITERWAEYEDSCVAANTLFNKIVAQAKIVQGRGIHFGSVDDTELETLEAMLGEYSKFFYTNDVTSVITGIKSSLEKLLSGLNRSGSGSRTMQIFL